MDHMELRERLASTPVAHLDEIADLFRELMDKVPRGVRVGSIDGAETVRRAEHRLALAIRAAQERGEVCSKSNLKGGLPLSRYVPEHSSLATSVHLLMKFNQEDFEVALKSTREKHGTMSRRVLLAELQRMLEFMPTPVPVRAFVRPTKRGERLVKNLAMTANSLAAACDAVNVGEVDGAALRELVEKAREDVGVIRGFLKRVKVDV